MKKFSLLILAAVLLFSCGDSDQKPDPDPDPNPPAAGTFPVDAVVSELNKLNGYQTFAKAIADADWTGVKADKVTVFAVPDRLLQVSSANIDVKRHMVASSVSLDDKAPGNSKITMMDGRELELKRRRQGGFFLNGVIVSESFDTNNQILIHKTEELMPDNIRILYSMITDIYLHDGRDKYAAFTYDERGRVETFADNWGGLARFTRNSAGNITQAVMGSRTMKYTATGSSISKIEITNSTMEFKGTHQVRTYTVTGQKIETEYDDDGFLEKNYDNVIMDTIRYFPGSVQYSQSNFLKAIPYEWIIGNKLDKFFSQVLFGKALELYYCDKSPMFVKYNRHNVKYNGRIEELSPESIKIDYNYDDYFGDNYPTDVIISSKTGDGELWDDVTKYRLEYYDFVRIP